jgi:DNA repair protein RecO (recombination protein O)
MDSTGTAHSGRNRERLYRANAIVLRRLDYGETDRIYTVLSERLGKLSIIAKGVRRPTSRIGAHLELLSVTQLMLARGRDLDVVSAAETLESHHRLRTDLVAFGVASHCAEITDRFLADRDVNRPVFRTLSDVLSRLDAGDQADTIGRWYELFLLEQMGVRPELFQCVVCERPVEERPNPFSSRLGGVLCQDHSRQDSSSALLSVAAQKVLRLMTRSPLDAVIRLNIGAQTRVELQQALSTFLKTQLDRDLVSLNVSRRVEETLPAYDQTSTK